ncbi:hypothetical protein Tco_0382480 [Tanacetum coccineum]
MYFDFLAEENESSNGRRIPKFDSLSHVQMIKEYWPRDARKERIQVRLGRKERTLSVDKAESCAGCPQFCFNLTGAKTLCRKKWIEPLRVRALVMTIGLDLPKRILEAQIEAQKPKNIVNEDVGGMIRRDIPKERLESALPHGTYAYTVRELDYLALETKIPCYAYESSTSQNILSIPMRMIHLDKLDKVVLEQACGNKTRVPASHSSEWFVEAKIHFKFCGERFISISFVSPVCWAERLGKKKKP